MAPRPAPVRPRRATAPALALALLLSIGPARADAPDPGIAVTGDAGTAVTLTPAELARLPAVTEAVAFATEHGPRQARFEGPLLWSVLDHAHAVVPGKAGGAGRRLVLLTGRDGYAAVLALGEVSPDFEGKPVLLALRVDGAALDHPRIVVPGDKRGGRSVHDVVRIAVIEAPGAPAH